MAKNSGRRAKRARSSIPKMQIDRTYLPPHGQEFQFLNRERNGFRIPKSVSSFPAKTNNHLFGQHLSTYLVKMKNKNGENSLNGKENTYL